MDQELHQLFDPESSTFTYVLVDLATREAVVVDSVDQLLERDKNIRCICCTFIKIFQKSFFVSSRIVTGPSFTSSTSIIA
jgi:hypothetical protein